MRNVVKYVLVIATLAFGLSAANTNAEIWPYVFFDDFYDLAAWTEMPSNCPGFTLASDGSSISPTSYGTCGTAQWEGIAKTLDIPIAVNEDFEVSFRPIAMSDPSGQMGGVVVFCMNDLDEIVAQLSWYEPQASSGYGGVAFWAEGSLIYGNLTGFDSEYPTIDATLKLTRSGNQWSAWVDDTQKGSTLTLSPSKEITRLEVAF